jgi:thymidine kinase
MSLELLIGPMFAGKSSAIQSIVRRHQALGWKVLVLTHKSDVRYQETEEIGDELTVKMDIVNHDMQRLPADGVGELLPCRDLVKYKTAKLIIIEEAQFFPDLPEFVLSAVDDDRKHVVVVGLDGDAHRKPFGRILELIPHCDKVTKLTSFCHECADTTPAIFTLAVNKEAAEAAKRGEACVGGKDEYVPLCRMHYNLHKQLPMPKADEEILKLVSDVY